jgi:transcriptional regulator with XRE-family HTH domain
MNDHSFAARLIHLREAAGLSQYELARRTGLTRQTLSRLEMGESVPTWPTVQLLARALGVDCTSFVDPNLQTPSDEPTRARGRPRREGEAKPAAKRATGKTRKRKVE